MLATGRKDESVKQPCKPQPEVCACLAARLFRAGVLGGEGALLMVPRPRLLCSCAVPEVSAPREEVTA